MHLALVAWVLFVTAVTALHADEAGVVDWHHKLIGTPLEGSTFLHKPIAGSGALAYTLTDKNVLAALNLRDGAIGSDHNVTKANS
jgi:ER membrane protein complex subunit 1